MTQGIIQNIRKNFRECLTRSCRENKCSLHLDGVDESSMAIIHGSKYQKKREFGGKLCDRILFCEHQGLVLASVELKGGKKARTSQAIEQIQNGLTVAAKVLGKSSVKEWFPLLLYSGSMHPQETKVLRMKRVRFRGELRVVERHDCGTGLSKILSY